MKTAYATSSDFPLRASVRFVAIALWTIAFLILLIPFGDVTYRGILSLLKYLTGEPATTSQNQFAVVATISVSIGILVGGIVLIVLLTRKVPSGFKFSFNKISQAKDTIKSRLFGFRRNWRFTIMFIPHSEKGIFNLQATLFTLLFPVFVFIVVFVGFIITATYFPIKRAAFNLTTSSIEKRLEADKEAIAQLENERSDLEGILKTERNAVSGFYSNQIRTIRALVLGSNFVSGFCVGFISSLAASFVFALIMKIASGRKNSSKQTVEPE